MEPTSLRRAFLGVIALALTLGPILGLNRVTPILAQEDDSDYISPEESFTGEIYNQIDSLGELDTLFGNRPALVLSPQDRNLLQDKQVDIRVTDYLLYLVRPVSQGGAGLTHVKAGRILKGYTGRGPGRLDRETLDALDEDRFESSHARGSAVDLTEVGKVTCKLIKRRHVGGDSTKWQAPRPVKVAWQSKDGISRYPTPRGPSLTEIAGGFSALSIVEILNQSGEMDGYIEFAQGLDLATIFQYVGANILLQTLEINKVSSDPLADSILSVIGGTVLVEQMRGLPEGLTAGENDIDARAAIAKEHLTDKLGLPPGSLHGKGWPEVVESVGKRNLEKALGLPALFLDEHSLEELNDLETAKAAFKQFKGADRAFNLWEGTIEKILDNDPAGLRLIGAKVLADVLRVTEEQRAKIEEAAKADKVPELDPTALAVDKSIPLTIIAQLLSTNQNDHRELEQSLIDLGLSLIGESLRNLANNRYASVSSALIEEVLLQNSQGVTLGELKVKVGSRTLAIKTGLSPEDGEKLSEGKSSRLNGAVATLLNEELRLGGESAITAGDVSGLRGRGNYSLIEKIGGSQVDLVIGWNSGTGLQIIRGQKSLHKALEEAFFNNLAITLGLPQGTNISLEGDPVVNYGLAIVASRLNFSPDELESKDSAADFDDKTLRDKFGGSPEQWLRTDIRLGADAGSIEKFLKNELSLRDLARQIGLNNLKQLAVDQVWNLLDLTGEYRRDTTDAFSTIIDTITNWQDASAEKKENALRLAAKIFGRSLDEKSGFRLDTFIKLASAENAQEATKILLNEGIRIFAAAVGSNAEGFTAEGLNDLTERLIKAINGELNALEANRLMQTLLKATGVPEEYRDDLLTFLRGDYRAGLEYWSAAMWSEFGTKYLPEGVTLTYEEIRNSLNFSNEELINQKALELYNEANGTNLTIDQFVGLPDADKEGYLLQSRRLLMQQLRDEIQYKISDAFLNQALADLGVVLPENFTKVMMTGDAKAKAELLENFAFGNLDRILARLDARYEPGTLKKIFDGEITSIDVINLVKSIVANSADFGPFDGNFVSQFITYITNPRGADIYSDEQFGDMWNYLEGWFNRYVGDLGLPKGYVKSIFLASANGWDFNAEVRQGDNLVVPSLAQIGEAVLVSQITRWADKLMGLPAGSMYQIYQATVKVIQASRALALARAAAPALNGLVEGISGIAGAGGAAVQQAQAALKQATNQLIALAITIALNACSACQQFFAAVDRALAAPPGFTNMAVAGAIGMALGLGPAGLVVAAVYYLVGVYRVDYLCPVPPPDRYSIAEFDESYDQLDYVWGSDYADPSREVASSPVEGIDKDAWAWEARLKVRFVNGNNPNLWMAWARYFTGRALEATLDYGVLQESRLKPNQVITYRQANVEFFAGRSTAAFGQSEANNPFLGMGFTQKSTKITEVIHVGFGGLY